MGTRRLLAMCALALGPGSARATVLEPSFVEEIFVQSSELEAATALAWAPDGSDRLFVTRRTGEIRIVKNGQLLAAPFATIAPLYTGHPEAGIQGLAFDPDFLVDPYVYVFVTVSSSEQQIIRYTVSGDTGTDKTILVRGLPGQGVNHNGGALGFGPDGKLYFAVGDVGNKVGVMDDLTTLGSTVGRVNRDGSVPADNPFFDGAGPHADAIWARGFRNPFSMTFQPATGLLWLNVVGSLWEQVFVVRRGDHGGWEGYENDQPAPFIAPRIGYRTNASDVRDLAASAGAVRANNLVTFTTTTPHHVRPGEMLIVNGVTDLSFNGQVDVASTPTDTTFTAAQKGPDATSGGGTSTSEVMGGCLTGGVFYDASNFPEPYRGDFFFGDYKAARIYRATLDPATNGILRVRQFAAAYTLSVDVALGPDGALYQTGISDGIIRRVRYQPTVQGLVVSPLHLWMAEGQGAVAMVRLATMPAQSVTVAVASADGDTDVQVSAGRQLTFTPGNWNVPQAVTIVAGCDLDTTDDVAALSVSAAGLDSQTISVHARDENRLALATSTTALELGEGKGGSFEVSLSARPSLDVVVSVERASGDVDLTVSPATLTFTAANWAIPRPVTVSAAADVDVSDDLASIAVRAPGLVERLVTVVAIDDGLVADAAAPDAPLIPDAGAPDVPVTDLPTELSPTSDGAANVTEVGGEAAVVAPPPGAFPDAWVADGGTAAESPGCGCRLGGQRAQGPGAVMLLALLLLIRGRVARRECERHRGPGRAPPI
jgi:glucose/arabinose dehydrogenase